jgi:hypothetical protein
MKYFIDQSYMKPSDKTSAPEQSTFEIKHYIICDKVQKGERGSPLHISRYEKISRHFCKSSVQNERVCVLMLELMEITSVLKKEEMTPRLGGSTNMYLFMDSHVLVRKNKWSRMRSFLSNSESGLRFMMDNDFALWLTWEMVQIVDVS